VFRRLLVAVGRGDGPEDVQTACLDAVGRGDGPEDVYESLFYERPYGFRPKPRAHAAVRVRASLV